MTVSAVGSNQSAWELMKQRRAAMQEMQDAVQAGDIQGAQSGLATLKQLTPSQSASTTGSSTSQSDNPFRSTLRTDLSNLENAVSSGNLSDAKSSLATLQHDRAAGPRGGASDHDGDDNASSSTASSFGTDLSQLLTSALSGDASGSSTAAAAVAKDLQALTSGSSDQSATQSGSNPVVDDLKALLAASSNANGSAASGQDAALKLIQDLQSGQTNGAGAAHHAHHHHHHQEAELSTTTPSAPASADAASSVTATSVAA